ncbi:hypothetical protein RRG08_053792 [Elysia crispata]|uniref:Uncharacterized protein n=1 Tax=Elysia crispata TaxID=231223 RepID=A0AAE1DD36_9GAST|nr:hypothetical protein RRG08_053792 [Elysia crispata]
MVHPLVLWLALTYVVCTSVAEGFALSAISNTKNKTKELHMDQTTGGAEGRNHVLNEAVETAKLIFLTSGQLKDSRREQLRHDIRKRQATQLAVSVQRPPDSSSATGTLGISHVMGGGGGTSFGGQLGASTDGTATWGLNAGHMIGSTNLDTNFGGTFGGGTNWGASAGGSLGGDIDWTATADGQFGGDTNWGVNLDKTWQHAGGSSSSLGAWVKNGNGGTAAGLKYELNL